MGLYDGEVGRVTLFHLEAARASLREANAAWVRRDKLHGAINRAVKDLNVAHALLKLGICADQVGEMMKEEVR